MTSAPAFDAAVIGGGVIGCSAALHLARGGQSVVLLERQFLCAGASGVNAGTMALQHAPRVELVPYARSGHEMWRTASQWLGTDMGFRETGGLVLAFTEDEAERLEARARSLQALDVPTEVVSLAQARRIEPHLSDRVTLATHGRRDGSASANLTGAAFRRALGAAGVDLREWTPAQSLQADGGGWSVVAGDTRLRARRVLLAANWWNRRLLAGLGLTLDMTYAINQMTVTELRPPVFTTNIGVLAGNLSLKSASNGSILIGGGWQAEGHPDAGGARIIMANLVGNLRLAHQAIPAIADARIVRTWIGFRDHSRDALPIAGEVPGHPDLFVAGCVRDGYMNGPYVGKLMAQRLMDEEPELPLWDPARLLTATPVREAA